MRSGFPCLKIYHIQINQAIIIPTSGRKKLIMRTFPLFKVSRMTGQMLLVQYTDKILSFSKFSRLRPIFSTSPPLFLCASIQFHRVLYMNFHADRTAVPPPHSLIYPYWEYLAYFCGASVCKKIIFVGFYVRGIPCFQPIYTKKHKFSQVFAASVQHSASPKARFDFYKDYNWLFVYRYNI